MRSRTPALVLLLATFGVLCAPIPGQSAPPSASSRLALGFASRAVGTDFGSDLSITSPYFSHDRFALRATWAWMDFAAAGTKVDARHYHIAGLDFVWSAFITDRLRGVWKIGIGVIPEVSDVYERTSLIGTGNLGLEYFPGEHAKITFFAEGGATRAAGLTEDDTRPPFGSGVVFITGLKFYL